jgi:uncharacterized RDD family membrane protein YckC
MSDVATTVPLDQSRYVNFFWRILATIFDVIILVILISIAYGLTPISTHIFVNLIVSIGYYAILLGWKSRTIGQAILKQRVVTLEYQRLPADVAVKRAAWITISYLLFGIPFLAILFTKKRQAMHDVLARTVVIHQ